MENIKWHHISFHETEADVSSRNHKHEKEHLEVSVLILKKDIVSTVHTALCVWDVLGKQELSGRDRCSLFVRFLPAHWRAFVLPSYTQRNTQKMLLQIVSTPNIFSPMCFEHIAECVENSFKKNSASYTVLILQENFKDYTNFSIGLLELGKIMYKYSLGFCKICQSFNNSVGK